MSEYARVHSERGNLLIHLVAVPLFWWGCLGAIDHLARQEGWLALVQLLLLPGSLWLQGMGHRREREAPAPFAGPGDFLRRLFVEQFYRFPRFVLSGSWARAWGEARRTA